MRKLLRKHPHLQDFAKSGGIKVFAVRAKSFQLIEGVNRAHFEEVD